MLRGRVVEANSLKELLRRVLIALEQDQPGFMKRLTAQPTPRGRRVVALSPEALYPNTPHLAELAERVDAEWWFDTNVSRKQVDAYLQQFARMVHLPDIPTVHKRAEKTALTLEDLGLA